MQWINEGGKILELGGHKQKFDPNQIILGFGSKVWINEVALIWHHFPTKFWWGLQLRKWLMLEQCISECMGTNN